VSFGFCAARKAPRVLVDAAAQLEQPVQLVFAGSCTDDARAGIYERAAAHGIAERVHITGYLDEDGYRDWLRRAWCAVQLRTVDFGESTGTVHDAMAAGVPVITNVASVADFPAGTVVSIGLEAGQLAAQLDAVLFDGHTAPVLSRRAQAHAATWTFADVAGRFLEIVESTIPEASRAFVRLR
jgi:glycosyltransferase involved in cell wall biosynthesis